MATIEEKRLPNGAEYLWGDRPAPKGTVEIGIWPRPDQLVAMRTEAAMTNSSVSEEPQTEETPKSPLKLAEEKFHAVTKGEVPYDGDALDGAWTELLGQITADPTPDIVTRYLDIEVAAYAAREVAVANNDSERAATYGRLEADANWLVEQYL